MPRTNFPGPFPPPILHLILLPNMDVHDFRNRHTGSFHRIPLRRYMMITDRACVALALVRTSFSDTRFGGFSPLSLFVRAYAGSNACSPAGGCKGGLMRGNLVHLALLHVSFFVCTLLRLGTRNQKCKFRYSLLDVDVTCKKYV